LIALEALLSASHSKPAARLALLCIGRHETQERMAANERQGCGDWRRFAQALLTEQARQRVLLKSI